LSSEHYNRMNDSFLYGYQFKHENKRAVEPNVRALKNTIRKLIVKNWNDEAIVKLLLNFTYLTEFYIQNLIREVRSE
jgi:hypothetical protein